MTLSIAEQERKYESERSGTLYATPEPTPRLADYAASPEARALYDTLSPDAQRLTDRLIAIIDAMPDDEAERAIDLVCLTLDDLAPTTPAAPALTISGTAPLDSKAVEACVWPNVAAEPEPDDEDEDEDMSEEEEAAEDAANQQK